MLAAECAAVSSPFKLLCTTVLGGTVGSIMLPYSADWLKIIDETPDSRRMFQQ